jgi:hypothetical protein
MGAAWHGWLWDALMGRWTCVCAADTLGKCASEVGRIGSQRGVPVRFQGLTGGGVPSLGTSQGADAADASVGVGMGIRGGQPMRGSWQVPVVHGFADLGSPLEGRLETLHARLWQQFIHGRHRGDVDAQAAAAGQLVNVVALMTDRWRRKWRKTPCQG